MAENQKPKICIAIHGLSHGGAERVASSWANYLAIQGYPVVILMYACGEDNYDLDQRVRVLPLANTREQYFRMPIYRKLACMRRAVQQEKPDILISFLPKMQVHMMLATWGLRLKRIETVRNNPWIDKDVDGKRFLWNLCFQRSDKFIVQTKEQSEYFPERLQKKCVVISNPVTDGFWEKQKVYKTDDVSKFIAVARLNDQKNYPMMIRAFAQAAQKNPSCILDIYGAGTSEKVQEIQTLIAELGMEKQIHLCGWRKDVAELLTTYDAFLMSSDYEGMPNALAEAMASGMVCLSTDCKTGPKDMIDDGKNGFLAKTGDVHSYARGIEAILKMNREECAAMGRAAREKMQEMCGTENTLARLKQLIETIM